MLALSVPVAATPSTTWSLTDHYSATSIISFSNGNMRASVGSSNENIRVMIRATNPKTSGKWYAEVAGSISSGGSGTQGFDIFIGVGSSAASLTLPQYSATDNNAALFYVAGPSWFTVLNSGLTVNLPSGATGLSETYGLAFDVGANLFWFCRTGSNFQGWSNEASHDFTGNPTTGTGGIAIPSGTGSGVMIHCGWYAYYTNGNLDLTTIAPFSQGPPTGYSALG
jgi:hypothetical protein